MRKSLGVVALSLAGLAFGSGADPDGPGKKVLLVYSADERSELAPCG
ncbi:MAG: hypothetical protein ACRDGR_05340 [bacterium]